MIYAKVEREHLRELPRREHPLSAEDLQAAANVAAQELPALPEGQAIEVAKLVAPPASASTPGEEPQLAQPKPWPMPPALRPRAAAASEPPPTPAAAAAATAVPPAAAPPGWLTGPAAAAAAELAASAAAVVPAAALAPAGPAAAAAAELAASATLEPAAALAPAGPAAVAAAELASTAAVAPGAALAPAGPAAAGLAARQAVYKKAAEQAAKRDARASTPRQQDERGKAEESSGGETIECESDVEESDRPAAALSEGQGSFRRQGLPARVFVDRIGDVYHHVNGRHLMVEKLAEILQERRLAMARASTSGEVMRKNNWVILARPLQEMVMNNLFEHWCKGEGQPYDQKIVDQRMVKTPQQHQRKLKGYFKTYCDQVFGGQLWYKMMIALGDVPPESVQAANDVVRLRIWETSGREAGTASRPQCPDNIFGCCCSYRCCCCCFATGASVVGGSHRSQKSEVRVGRLLQTQAHGAHALVRPRSPCLDAGREGRGRVGEASSEAAQGGEGQDAAAAEAAVLDTVRGGLAEVGGGGPRDQGVANEGGRGEDGLRVPLRRLQRRLAARADEDSCQHFRGGSLPHPLRARPREGGGRQRGAE